jgi:hypothetical protein
MIEIEDALEEQEILQTGSPTGAPNGTATNNLTGTTK